MSEPDAILEIRDLSIDYVLRRSVLGRPREVLRAVDHVNLTIRAGETLGLVGESGSGKSTLGRGLLRLVEITSGSVSFDGRAISSMSQRAFRPLRRHMQIIFQDPYSSLNPSHTVEELVAEPLVLHERGLSRPERRERVVTAMNQVDLDAGHLSRYAHEFSGGQRQRIAIARAIVLAPRFIVCDEAVSGLDVSIKSRIGNLLADLQKSMHLTYLFISHDFDIVRALSDTIAVMYLGRIVEIGPSRRVVESPAHPYTDALVAAIPIPDPLFQRARPKVRLVGEIPSPLNPPAGCRFHTRCPHAMEICRQIEPHYVPVAGGGIVACHLYSGDSGYGA